MSRSKEWIVFAVIAALVIATSYLTGGTAGTVPGSEGNIKIAHNNWAENIAVSHLWKQLLEEKGYRVQLIQTEKAPVWAGVADGSVDMLTEAWLPHTDKPYYKKYKKQIELHDAWYEGTGLGLVVPEYMENIDTIEDLKQNEDQFIRNGEPSIVGIDAGASLMRLSEKAIKEYRLDYNLIESSEPAMLSELDKAYKNKKPLVVTLWNPHWAFKKYDLKYLKDDKKVYGEGDTIYYATRNGFKNDHPEIVRWMDRWKMDDDSLGELILAIEESDPEKGTIKWIEENRDLVDQWLQE
ncbi:glycine betaine ABC transporter substrate-binding protein [Paludifilum halophilum]|uniref:Glycine/betaine ABC transporter n=1 Tax=Paludifilum halophilum TaxID=1642702 RepID=A0A235B816_9BACL|nr:glycine betaine ABC transporter substrate-binding protein [Paludifilum halophilum]OYD08426.1 glycine/betaine ABC transporter [Paludifilum halophilum]